MRSHVNSNTCLTEYACRIQQKINHVNTLLNVIVGPMHPRLTDCNLGQDL